jgi:hypothetical protein
MVFVYPFVGWRLRQLARSLRFGESFAVGDYALLVFERGATHQERPDFEVDARLCRIYNLRPARPGLPVFLRSYWSSNSFESPFFLSSAPLRRTKKPLTLVRLSTVREPAISNAFPAALVAAPLISQWLPREEMLSRLAACRSHGHLHSKGYGNIYRGFNPLLTKSFGQLVR